VELESIDGLLGVILRLIVSIPLYILDSLVTQIELIIELIIVV
jgi:hypothetical protein